MNKYIKWQSICMLAHVDYRRNIYICRGRTGKIQLIIFLNDAYFPCTPNKKNYNVTSVFNFFLVGSFRFFFFLFLFIFLIER